jgi:hypothetical protein
VDRIRVKLSAWKASLLSIAGRLQLVKLLVLGMIQHTIALYCWPASSIKSLECSIRNFIWSGDVNKRKLVTVAYHILRCFSSFCDFSATFPLSHHIYSHLWICCCRYFVFQSKFHYTSCLRCS